MTDLIKLYSTKILALAADIPHQTPLKAPMAEVKRRSPLCGSQVTVQLDVKDGRISGFAQDVKACALGQASAAIFGAHVMGQDLAGVQTALADLNRMLAGGDPPTAPFDDYKFLQPAADYGNRHASIRLAAEATEEALLTICKQ